MALGLCWCLLGMNGRRGCSTVWPFDTVVGRRALMLFGCLCDWFRWGAGEFNIWSLMIVIFGLQRARGRLSPFRLVRVCLVRGEGVFSSSSFRAWVFRSSWRWVWSSAWYGLNFWAVRLLGSSGVDLCMP